MAWLTLSLRAVSGLFAYFTGVCLTDTNCMTSVASSHLLHVRLSCPQIARFKYPLRHELQCRFVKPHVINVQLIEFKLKELLIQSLDYNNEKKLKVTLKFTLAKVKFS